MDYNIVIAFIGGIFVEVLFRLISESFKRESQEIKPENVSDAEHSLLSQYHYAIARVYEGKDDKGFPTMTIRPLSMCKDETGAVNGAREQRKYESEIIMTNPTCDLRSLSLIDNIRAIKIYEVD